VVHPSATRWVPWPGLGRLKFTFCLAIVYLRYSCIIHVLKYQSLTLFVTIHYTKLLVVALHNHYPLGVSLTNPAPETAPVENGNGINQGAETTKAKRTQPSKTLPSDRLAPAKQLAALRAFAAAYESNGGKPVTNGAAGSIIGMSGTTVVVTNAFFSDIKLLVRQKEGVAFVPAAEALAYYKAYERDKVTAAGKLRSAFERGWFAEALVPRLKFRPYDVREALAVLAEASGVGKEDYEDRLANLLELMLQVGLVSSDGGLIKAAEQPAVVESVRTEPPVADRREAPVVDEGHEQYTLVLDPKSKRRVVVTAPHVITRKELDRITKWLEFQLLVEDPEHGKAP
jgi:hypothetical protein